jgi:nucleoside-diphosphate-sugar epimerase
VRYEKVAVTGGAGRLGRHVVEEMRRVSAVTSLDRVARAPDEMVVDVLDFEGLKAALAGHDAVIHLAAADASANVPADATFRINTSGTWNVLEAARQAGARKVVVCSSMAALGIWRERPPLYLPMDEAHPPQPADAYALSKQVGEYIARNFAANTAMKVAAVRPSYITFPEIVDYIRERVGTEREEGVGTPGQGTDYQEGISPTRSYIRPDDLARAFRLVLERDAEGYEVFNIAAADSFSPEPPLDFCRALFGFVPEVRDPRRWRDDPQASLIDCSAAAELLGWRPTGRWRDIAG